ncbi:MAG: catalase-peroxidase, partial [Microbacterium sp.]
NLLGVSAPQMTALVGGLRALGATYDRSTLGVLTDRPGTLTNDFFVNLLDLDVTWTSVDPEVGIYEGRDASGEVRWTGSRADLVFGSNSELRAVAEVYASDDGADAFVDEFVGAWVKVMEADRFDLPR